MRRILIKAAQVVSIIFNPLYLPILGMIILFVFSYLSMLSWQYKLQVLITVFFFTIMLPSYMIYWYRRYHGWTMAELAVKERRMVPYIVSIVCYLACYYIMNMLRIPRFMGNIILVSLVVQLICGMINSWWKVSTHSAASGAVTGALIAFSLIFGFNPVWWLCLTILLSGMVGTSRMILRQHTLAQVLVGFAIGFVVAFVVLLFVQISW